MALLAALAPPVAPAGGIHGTRRTCPPQFMDGMRRVIDVEMTRNHGVDADKYTYRSLKPGDLRRLDTGPNDTGGGLSAGDDWSVGVYDTDGQGKRWVAYRALGPFDLTAGDAGVPSALIAGLGDYN